MLQKDYYLQCTELLKDKKEMPKRPSPPRKMSCKFEGIVKNASDSYPYEKMLSIIYNMINTI